MNPITCVQLENLLPDYLDGKAGERVDIETHLASCDACGLLVEDMRFAMRSLDSLQELDTPPMLVARIIEQTSGSAPAGVANWKHSLSGWWDWTRASIVRPLLEPRFAISMAMSVISVALLASLAGIDVRKIKLRDLDPVNIVHKVDRGVHVAGAKASKAYNDLRVVYEIQTQIQVLREQRSEAAPDAPVAAPKPAVDPAKKPATNPAPSGKASRIGELDIQRWTEEAAD